MKICYIVVSAFLIIFYPRQLTHLMCFGRHRDKNIVKSKAAYWGIYLFLDNYFFDWLSDDGFSDESKFYNG